MPILVKLLQQRQATKGEKLKRKLHLFNNTNTLCCKFPAIQTLSLLVLLLAIQAQNKCGAEEYEYWGDDYFTDTLRSDTKFADSISSVHLSYGMLPEVIMFPHFSVAFNIFPGDYSSGSFLFNDNYASRFFAQPSRDDVWDRMEELEKFSDENKYSWFINELKQFHSDIAISFTYPLPKQLHTFVNASIGYVYSSMFAFSPIRDVPYLNYKNEKAYFQQMSFAEIRNKTIYGDVSFKHPIYGISGAAIGPQLNYAENMFYYIMYGVGGEISLSDKISVYEYVMSAQDEVRFTGGDMREASTYRENFDRIDKVRIYYLLGIGWQFASSDYYFDVELRYKAALQPTITNSDYKQKQLYVRFGMSVNVVYNMFVTLRDLFAKLF